MFLAGAVVCLLLVHLRAFATTALVAFLMTSHAIESTFWVAPILHTGGASHSGSAGHLCTFFLKYVSPGVPVLLTPVALSRFFLTSLWLDFYIKLNNLWSSRILLSWVFATNSGGWRSSWISECQCFCRCLLVRNWNVNNSLLASRSRFVSYLWYFTISVKILYVLAFLKLILVSSCDDRRDFSVYFPYWSISSR